MGSSKLKLTLQWIISSWIFLFVQSTIQPTFASVQQPQVHRSVVQYWATTLGTRLNKTSYEQSGIAHLRAAYKRKESDLHLSPVSGEEIRDALNQNIEEFLWNKITAVRRIRESAENAFRTYDYSSDPPNDYLYALSIDLTTEDVTKDPHFGFEEVLLDESTIHVPTVVYREERELLQGVSATSRLDETFKQNAEKDPSLMWQYFGSTTGFMRNYPGVFWETDEDGLNLYDARQRIWYSQTIASPKTVLFLIDVSGSQTGLAISMTRLMVSQTIDTLGDNDFFNIVTFNDTTAFLESCYTEFPLQATYENKKLMKEKLDEIEPENESDVCDAFSFAFDTLARFRDYPREYPQYPGSDCSEIIMLFTDGVEFSCDNVFQERNGNKSVRVFTYLLGESVQHARILQEIACNNHGKYTRISVRSDVVEKVADYLPVIGRPLAQQGAHPTVWTNAYRDFQNGNIVITVSEPVHNTTPVHNATEQGSLEVFGVASVDIAVDSLLEIAPPYKFGVNGYFFMTTNNGYITYHPRQRNHYLQTGEVIEGTSTQDILDLEQSENFDEEVVRLASGHGKYRTNIPEMQVRNGMIASLSSNSTRLDVEIPYEGMKRIRSLTQEYFYTHVEDTIFSLATVIATDGQQRINPPQVVQRVEEKLVIGTSRELVERAKDQLDNGKSKDMIKFAEWIPCHSLRKDEVTTEQQVEIFLEELLENKPEKERTVYCALDWINLLLLDCDATFEFLNNWNQSYKEQNENVTYFLATTSGLNLENHTGSSYDRFTRMYPNTLVEDYFARAVNDAKDLEFVYSVPFKSEETEVNLDTEEELMTAYSAVQINGKTLAVSGYQMALSDFQTIFDSVTEAPIQPYEDCPKVTSGDMLQCNYTCDLTGIACLLIDQHGYIAASTDDSQIGEHIATAKTDLFHNLLENGTFQKLVYIDHQGRCPKVDDKEPSSAWFLLNPLSQAKNLMVMMFHKAFVILMTFNWYEWLSVSAAPQNITNETVGYVQYESCDVEYSFYQLRNISPGAFGVISSECYSSSYSLVSVVNTNLFLLVEAFPIDREEPTEARCVPPGTYSLAPKRVLYNESGAEEERCRGMWMPQQRQPPGYCTTSNNESKSNEIDECDGCFLLRPSWLILASLVLYHVSSFAARSIS